MRLKVKDFKKGDLIRYYDATLKVTKDARPSKHIEDVYIAECIFIEGNEDLKNYDYFQANDLITFEKIN